jgi:putative endonuclease
LNPLAPLYRLADRLRYYYHADTGKGGEDLAHRFLRRQGFLIVARNWRPPQGGGEIDLIACEPSASGDTLVFVEVKSRVSGEFSSPEREIDTEKLIALRRAARDYVRRARADPGRIRFDVVAITGDNTNRNIEHFRDAFPKL